MKGFPLRFLGVDCLWTKVLNSLEFHLKVGSWMERIKMARTHRFKDYHYVTMNRCSIANSNIQWDCLLIVYTFGNFKPNFKFMIIQQIGLKVAAYLFFWKKRLNCSKILGFEHLVLHHSNGFDPHRSWQTVHSWWVNSLRFRRENSRNTVKLYFNNLNTWEKINVINIKFKQQDNDICRKFIGI